MKEILKEYFSIVCDDTVKPILDNMIDEYSKLVQRAAQVMMNERRLSTVVDLPTTGFPDVMLPAWCKQRAILQAKNLAQKTLREGFETCVLEEYQCSWAAKGFRLGEDGTFIRVQYKTAPQKRSIGELTIPITLSDARRQKIEHATIKCLTIDRCGNEYGAWIEYTPACEKKIRRVNGEFDYTRISLNSEEQTDLYRRTKESPHFTDMSKCVIELFVNPVMICKTKETHTYTISGELQCIRLENLLRRMSLDYTREGNQFSVNVSKKDFEKIRHQP